MYAGMFNELDCQRPASQNASLHCVRDGDNRPDATRDCDLRVSEERSAMSVAVSMPVSYTEREEKKGGEQDNYKRTRQRSDGRG